MMKKRSLVVKRVLGFFSLSAVLILMSGLAGCGYKTLPVAPQALVPRSITDLRYELNETGVTLYWSYPTQTLTGDEIDEIDDFVLYRAVVPVDSYCDTCPIPFGRAIVLPGGALPGLGGKMATYESSLLRPDNLYFFKVHSKTGWLAESGASNLVTFIWQTPPSAPTGLTAKEEDSRVSLHWQPVTTHIDDTEISGPVKYQVSRSGGGDSFENIGEPLTETVYEDSAVINTSKYFYRVQALAVYDKGTVGGGLSNTVEASPVDRTAPAVPVHVKATRTSSGIKIYWERGKEKDLSGYRVYRRQSGNSTPELIGEVLEPYNLYEDRNLPATGRLYYSVTSIDLTKPANESKRSVEAIVNR